MGLSINQNIAALNAYHNLSNTQNDLASSLEKLSSGFRINRAADDAAGLAISEGLRSQIGGLKVAVRNAQDGTSVVQTAEGALNESTSILQRMRDLSVQASNTGALSSDAKGNIQSEMKQLKSELSRIADTTQFNGTKLLDGSYTGKFQVGANVGETITVGVATAMGAKGLGVDNVDVTQTVASNASTATTVNGVAGSPGTTASVAVTSAAGSPLMGKVTWGNASFDVSSLDYSGDPTKLNASLTKQVQSLTGDTNLSVSYTADTGSGATLTINQTTAADLTTGFTQSTGADSAILGIDKAIRTVSTTRADLGAVQNRFDHTVKNLNVAVENLSASESRIRDTDMASEMVSFTRAQILSQAGTSMLAQANQLPQSVLKLLQ